MEIVIRRVRRTHELGEKNRMLERYTANTTKSKRLYKRAKNVLPAGVTYNIRRFEPYPFYTAKAIGSKLYDVDGNEYVDFWLGHTALILGHSPREVVGAVAEQIENGTHYGTSHELEVKLAEQVVRMVPSAEMVRFTNSGTEANMYATRLARAYTGRSKIAKFEGGWHGGYDALQVGVKYPYDLPESAGLTQGAVEDTVVLPFNDLEGVERRLKDKNVASVVIEPVLGAGGGIPADQGFLRGLRDFCSDHNILLIFDEVITGFRLAPGGAQQYYDVMPDITVLGKILGGGFPIGALCANKAIMERIDSSIYKRPNYCFHGGTFTGNPVTMTAGLATLKKLEDGAVTNALNKLGKLVRERIKGIFEEHGESVQITGDGSIFNVHFTEDMPFDAVSAAQADRKKLMLYNLSLISNGVFFLPTHNGTLSAAHSNEDMEKLFSATETYLTKKDS